jgi:hypothetical protein
METALSIMVGVGLSAACGFRIFVPLLTMSLAAFTGHLHLAPEFQWIGTWPALIAFGTATVVEIAGYYIPWLDHVLDVIATPSAIVAGTVITASMVTDMSPFLRWTLGVVAGGGAAGLVQTATVMTRTASLVGTGGSANPVVATAELSGSILTTLLALIAPAVALLLLAGIVGFAVVKVRSKKGETRIQGVSSPPDSQPTVTTNCSR